MSKIKDKIIEKLLNKINTEELTDKIAEKVAEKIINRNLGILDPPSIPNPAKPEPYYPWRDDIVVMYGVSTSPYRTSPYTITTSANVIKKKDKNKVNKK